MYLTSSFLYFINWKDKKLLGRSRQAILSKPHVLMRSASHSICRVAGGVYDGVFFVLSFFPRDVLGEILDLIEFLRVFLPILSVIDLLLSFFVVIAVRPR